MRTETDHDNRKNGSRKIHSTNTGMAVEGEEAVDLYVAEFWRRIDALNRQIGLLQNAFAERKQLLREIEEEEHDLRKGD